jgi:hypothetical protein
MYKLIITPPATQTTGILRIADNSFIPIDESNTDYQEYLKWAAEGNTPLPADEV